MAAAEGTTAEMEAQAHGHVDGSDLLTKVVVCLGPAYQDASPERLASLLTNLRTAFGAAPASLLVAYPASHGDAASSTMDGITLQPFLQSVAAHIVAVQPAASWLSAYEIVRAHNAECCLLLGVEAQSLQPETVRGLVEAVLRGKADLAVPRYALPPNQGLLNAGMLSPLSRAIYGADVQFPLALDYALSTRMAEKMAAAAQKFTAASQGDAILWPVGEAAVAGFTVAEVGTGHRELPQPDEDLSAILNMVAGSMFADVEAKATFWQRTRPAKDVVRSGATSALAQDPVEPPSAAETEELIQSFRIGYNNLHEIWSLVLPPNTLLGLKRLSQLPADSFLMPDALWVRVVYDFVLAHRLRTLSRNHLLGALTPLYLAWVASHILSAGANSAAGVQALGRAFEADKPYLVSRWRWPDRFNP